MRAGPLIAICLSTTACFGNEATEFPSGFEPLELENRAALPSAEGGDLHPERLEVVSGNRDTYDWAHARGYFHAPVARVYEALRVDGVVVDRRNVSEYSSEIIAAQGANAAMIVHNTVEDVLTVRFDITYRYAIVGGEEAKPTAVAARFQKTWGTELIGLLEGSMVITEVGAERTQIDFIEHINAALSGEERIRQAALDLHGSAIAWLRGQPLPEY